MSMPINPGYRFADSEKAKTLKKSEGLEKSRLHVLVYNGNPGEDRYAVAAEKISEKDAKLNCIERFFYVLHQAEDKTWYKVNKSSLTKRFNISADELEVNDTGLCTNFKTIVGNKQKFLEDLKNGSDLEALFHNVSDEWKSDYDFMMSCVEVNGLALKFASYKLQSPGLNFELVKTAVTQNGMALQFVLYRYGMVEQSDKNLKDIEEIVLIAVTENGMALQFAEDDSLLKYHIVLAAVTQNGMALQFVLKIYRATDFVRNFNDNGDIVLAAVTQNGMALQFAGDQLKYDEDSKNKMVEIIKVAVNQNPLAHGFVPQRFEKLL